MTFSPPWNWCSEHVAVACDALLSLPDPLVVVEWGAGNSTLFFSELLQRSGRNYEWHAFEAVPEWADYVDDRRRDLRITVHGFDYGTADQHELQRRCMGDYVDAPRALGLRPQCVLVDGRKRARCIDVARRILEPGGCIILHDAERRYYHAACDELSIEKHASNMPDRGDLWVMREHAVE